MVPYPIPSSTSKYDSSEDWQLKARFFGYWIKERGGKNGMHGCKRKKQGKKGKSRADQAYSRSNEINDCLFVPEPGESPSLFVRVSKHRHYTPMKEEGGEGIDQACRHFLTRCDRLPEKSPSNYESSPSTPRVNAEPKCWS